MATFNLLAKVSQTHPALRINDFERSSKGVFPPERKRLGMKRDCERYRSWANSFKWVLSVFFGHRQWHVVFLRRVSDENRWCTIQIMTV